MAQDAYIHHFEKLSEVNKVTGSEQTIFTSDEVPGEAVDTILYIKTETGYKKSGGGGGSTAIKVVTVTPAQSPYTVVGDEDVLLVDTTDSPVTINLLPSASATRLLSIKDENGTDDINAITIHPSGAETIDTVAGDADLFSLQGVQGSATLAPTTGGYAIV